MQQSLYSYTGKRWYLLLLVRQGWTSYRKVLLMGSTFLRTSLTVSVQDFATSSISSHTHPCCNSRCSWDTLGKDLSDLWRWTTSAYKPVKKEKKPTNPNQNNNQEAYRGGERAVFTDVSQASLPTRTNSWWMRNHICKTHLSIIPFKIHRLGNRRLACWWWLSSPFCSLAHCVGKVRFFQDNSPENNAEQRAQDSIHSDQNQILVKQISCLGLQYKTSDRVSVMFRGTTMFGKKVDFSETLCFWCFNT